MCGCHSESRSYCHLWAETTDAAGLLRGAGQPPQQSSPARSDSGVEIEIPDIIRTSVGHQFHAALSKIQTLSIDAARWTSSRKPVSELISKT